MLISEYQIGDLLYIDYNGNRILVRVIAVDADTENMKVQGVVDKAFKYTLNLKYDDAKCKPIPVAELEKIGFKRENNESRLYTIDCGPNRHSMNCYSYGINYDVFIDDTWIRGVTWIHELQQIMRVCRLRRVADMEFSEDVFKLFEDD